MSLLNLDCEFISILMKILVCGGLVIVMIIRLLVLLATVRRVAVAAALVSCCKGGSVVLCSSGRIRWVRLTRFNFMRYPLLVVCCSRVRPLSAIIRWQIIACLTFSLVVTLSICTFLLALVSKASRASFWLRAREALVAT